MKKIQVKSDYPPTIGEIGGKTYICPGWIEVNKNTTLEDIEWIRPDYYIRETKPAFEMKVKSASGNEPYTVKFDGEFWSCNCLGFTYRKRCHHIDYAKTHKNENTESN